VEAFHSTLEEATDADVILNVCDLSNPEADEHLKVTRELLAELGCGETPILSVFNKVDLVDDPSLLPRESIGISAVTGAGVDALLDAIAQALPPTRVRVEMLLPFHKGEIAPILRKNGVIHAEEYVAEGLQLDCTIDKLDAQKYSDYVVRIIE
jgi:GTP-binding protein HflX